LNPFRDQGVAVTGFQQRLDIGHGQGAALLSKGNTGTDDKITAKQETDRNADQNTRSEFAQLHIQQPDGSGLLANEISLQGLLEKPQLQNDS
jgi:hypothetical protein